MTVNGLRVYPGYTVEPWEGAEYGVLTVRNLGYSLNKVRAEGFNLCMVMATSSPCGTPEGLCYGNTGGCTYSVQDDTHTCCPVATVITQYLVGR